MRKWWWPHHSLSSSLWNTYFVWLLLCQSPSITSDVLKVMSSGDTVPCVHVLLQTWVSSPFTLIYLSATTPFRDWLVNNYIIIKNMSEKEGNWGQRPDIIVPKLPKKSCVKPVYITVPGFVCLNCNDSACKMKNITVRYKMNVCVRDKNPLPGWLQRGLPARKSGCVHLSGPHTGLWCASSPKREAGM